MVLLEHVVTQSPMILMSKRESYEVPIIARQVSVGFDRFAKLQALMVDVKLK